jgi:hypothetical protein
MNRRELIKAIPALAATGMVIADVSVGQAYEFKPGAKYLFVFRRGSLSSIESVRSLDVDGRIIFVDSPEEDLRIYRMDE